MIEIRTTRTYLEAAHKHFLPYVMQFKQTRLNNVAHHSHISEEYLAAVMINCLLNEVRDLIVKKLVNTSGHKVKLPLTDAQAVIWYKSLLTLPLPTEQVYLNQIRNEWLMILDQQLIENHILQPRRQPSPVDAHFEADDWE